MENSVDVRVYYEDTDAGGVVYYANYLKFAERARTEMLRERGISQQALMQDDGIAFVVRRVNVEFLKPAMLDDRLTITSVVHDITKATITMRQVIARDAETLVELEVKLAVIDQVKGKVSRMPEHVFAAFKPGF